MSSKLLPRAGASASVVAFVSLLLVGCWQEIRIDDPDGSPPPWDAGARFVPPTGKCVEGSRVDLLFVIDNSSSMTEEQASLARELPRLIQRLVDPPDLDGDSEPDWTPVTDLHVGVVTTDLGVGGFDVPTCRGDGGDDGVLRELGRTDIAGCAAIYPSFHTFSPAGGVSPEELAFDVSCVAQSTGGCGFEQPLEAALKALTPSTSTLRFANGTSGHGDGLNRGFLRDDSLLAVVVLTDEEDCSVENLDLFDPSGPFVTTDLNLRCFVHPSALHPVDRFVEGLRALRPDRPDLFAYGLIAGVPEDLATLSETDADYRRMLEDPRMQERIDPEMPSRLLPSCVVSTGIAFPPRRMVELARRFGPARSTVQSICADDFGPATEALARLVGARSCRTYED